MALVLGLLLLLQQQQLTCQCFLAYTGPDFLGLLSYINHRVLLQLFGM